MRKYHNENIKTIIAQLDSGVEQIKNDPNKLLENSEMKFMFAARDAFMSHGIDRKEALKNAVEIKVDIDGQLLDDDIVNAAYDLVDVVMTGLEEMKKVMDEESFEVIEQMIFSRMSFSYKE